VAFWLTIPLPLVIVGALVTGEFAAAPRVVSGLVVTTLLCLIVIIVDCFRIAPTPRPARTGKSLHYDTDRCNGVPVRADPGGSAFAGNTLQRSV